MTQPHQIAAYYFPGYHPDPRNDRWHGQGWTEWALLKRAEPRFPGHRQPKTPFWGYEDESDPRVMARKIDAAADYGLDAFIFDWYWYEGGPFLDGALERGFLDAPNNDRIKFALMWANHDWIDLFPAKRGGAPLLMPGATTRDAFDTATAHIVERYFAHPSYWRVDGRPYVSVYELMRLVRGLGGVDETRAALDDFRARSRAAGAGDPHLNAVVWGIQLLPGEAAGNAGDPNDILARLGFDSVTSYVWVHHTPLGGFPTVPYHAYACRAVEEWGCLAERYALPYYPNVTMGWDSSPRTVQSDVYEELEYPFMPVLDDNTPEEFGRALEQARVFLDTGRSDHPILTINAWNEWTEGSYLEPDMVHGMGYLEEIKRVFGGKV